MFQLHHEQEVKTKGHQRKSNLELRRDLRAKINKIIFINVNIKLTQQ